jgi:hypothetical protein
MTGLHFCGFPRLSRAFRDKPDDIPLSLVPQGRPWPRCDAG